MNLHSIRNLMISLKNFKNLRFDNQYKQKQGLNTRKNLQTGKMET